MKSSLIIFIITTGLLYAQLLGPKIYCPSDSYDFGKVKQGEIVRHSFVVVNKGDDTLKVLNIATSCGCTASDISKKILLPEESATVSVEFNSTGRTGSQHKYISITSNDKDKGLYMLNLTGEVSDESVPSQQEKQGAKIFFEENQFDFGAVEEGAILTHNFKFINQGNLDLEIKDIQTSCGCTAAVTDVKVIKPGDSGNLKVEFDTSNRFGRLSRTITLTTNEPDRPLSTITIYADIKQKENK